MAYQSLQIIIDLIYSRNFSAIYAGCQQKINMKVKYDLKSGRNSS